MHLLHYLKSEQIKNESFVTIRKSRLCIFDIFSAPFFPLPFSPDCIHVYESSQLAFGKKTIVNALLLPVHYHSFRMIKRNKKSIIIPLQFYNGDI